MTVRCIDCQCFNLRDSDMRIHHLGNCKRKPVSQYFSAGFKRRCSDFVSTHPSVVAKRNDWLDYTRTTPCTTTA